MNNVLFHIFLSGRQGMDMATDNKELVRRKVERNEVESRRVSNRQIREGESAGIIIVVIVSSIVVIAQ